MIGSRRSLAQTYRHVDPDWMSDFLLALRMREISGTRIGELLEEVAAHCAATGQDVRAAFGDPKDYASSLDFPGQDRAAGRVGVADLVLGVLSMVGVLLASYGGSAAVAGESFRLRASHLAILGLLVVLLALTVRCLEWVVTHIRSSTAILAFAVALMVGALLVGGPTLATLPATPVAALGFVLMLGSALAQTRANRHATPDLVVRPGECPSPRDRRESTVLAMVGVWLLPVVIGALLLVQWALTPR